MSFKRDRRPPTVEIDPRSDDIKEMKVWWYGPDEVFISQVEKDTGIEHVLLVSREAFPDLLAALKQFEALT